MKAYSTDGEAVILRRFLVDHFFHVHTVWACVIEIILRKHGEIDQRLW